MKIFMLRSLSLLAFAATAAASQAAFTFYTDRAAFVAATRGTTTLDFEGLPARSKYTTLSQPGVNFSSNRSDSDALFVPGGGNLVGVPSKSLFANHFGSSLIAEFTTPLTAVGADLFTPGTNSGVSITIAGTGGPASFTIATASATPTFFGVIATGGDTISALTFSPMNLSTSQDAVGVDDFTFGKASVPPSVPGPTAALPFALMALKRRKRA